MFRYFLVTKNSMVSYDIIRDCFAISHEDKRLLKDIDEFTTKFNDEFDLKTHLICSFNLDVDDIHKDICIGFGLENYVKSASDTVFYKDKKKFLDVDYLCNFLFLNINDERLRKMIKFIYNNNKYEKVMNDYLNNNEFNTKDNNLKKIICDFINEECFFMNNETLKKELSYERLHFLASFFADYNDTISYKKEHCKVLTKKNDLEG